MTLKKNTSCVYKTLLGLERLAVTREQAFQAMLQARSAKELIRTKSLIEDINMEMKQEISNMLDDIRMGVR